VYEECNVFFFIVGVTSTATVTTDIKEMELKLTAYVAFHSPASDYCIRYLCCLPIFVPFKAFLFYRYLTLRFVLFLFAHCLMLRFVLLIYHCLMLRFVLLNFLIV
jgi:hypothetical protein